MKSAKLFLILTNVELENYSVNTNSVLMVMVFWQSDVAWAK